MKTLTIQSSFANEFSSCTFENMYAIVDIETTGGHASSNGITEIAVLLHDGSRVLKRFETLVNPQQSIPRYIVSLTGITDEMVEDAPLFDDIAEPLYDLLRDAVFVAHNVNFDFSFVKHHLKQSGFDLASPKLCTVRLARKVFPQLPSYSLGNLCRSLQLPIENRHRAGGDAAATVLLWEKCLQEGGATHVAQMLKKTSGEQWLPTLLNKQAILQLPLGPGVYYFHDEKDKVIYVGKAINIRKRVSSHFTHHDTGKKRQALMRSIARISYKSCSTELEALVLESTEIKRLWPLYNRSQKKPEQKFGLYVFEDGKGYQRLAIDKKKKNLPAVYHFNLLHEGMVLLKKMIENFALHEKLCFIDKTVFTPEELSALESPEAYNQKIREALEALETQLPTFAVLDDGPSTDEQLCLLIERGSFWGMGYLPKSDALPPVEALKEQLQPYADNDTIRNNIYSFVAKHPEKKFVW